MSGRRTQYRWVAVLLALPAAYRVAFFGDALLNDDPCLDFATETSRIDDIDHWFPSRTDCQVTTAQADVRVGRREGRADGASASISEQPAHQPGQAGQHALEQPEDPGKQAADGTSETPQHAHRA